MITAVINGDNIAAQVLTFAIPVGTLAAVLLWGFFQRRPTREP